MANYSLVTNSTFQPFTYDELAAPIKELEKKYEELESGFDTLYSQALPIGSVLTSSDETQRRQYENYLKEVSELSDELAKTGYSRDLARKLIKAKNNYIQTIVPIESAVKSRAAQIEKQAVGREADPTIEYSYNAADTPLSKFIENPNLRYSSFSGEKLAKLGEDLATHYMNDLRGTSYSDIAELPGMVKVADIYGYTPQEMVTKFKNNPNDPIVAAAIEKALLMSGISNWEGVLDEDGAYTDFGNTMRDRVLNSLYAGAARKSDRQIKTSTVKKPEIDSDGSNSNGKDDKGLPYSITPRYLSPEIDNTYNSLYKTYNNVIDSKTGKIKSEYGDLNTAVKAYEELQVLNSKDAAKGNITYGDLIYAGDVYIPQMTDDTVENKNKNAKTIKDKYKISNILTDDEYATILKYASDTNDPESAIVSDLNKSAKRYTAYSINMSNYDAVENKVFTNLQRLKDTENLAGVITNIKGEELLPEELPDFEKAKIKDLEYSPRYPGKLIINISGKDYVIDPSLIHEVAQGIVNNLEYDYNIVTSDKAKQDVIDTQLGLLIKVINSENPTAQSSSSNVGILS